MFIFTRIQWKRCIYFGIFRRMYFVSAKPMQKVIYTAVHNIMTMLIELFLLGSYVKIRRHMLLLLYTKSVVKLNGPTDGLQMCLAVLCIFHKVLLIDKLQSKHSPEKKINFSFYVQSTRA